MFVSAPALNFVLDLHVALETVFADQSLAQGTKQPLTLALPALARQNVALLGPGLAVGTVSAGVHVRPKVPRCSVATLTLPAFILERKLLLLTHNQECNLRKFYLFNQSCARLCNGQSVPISHFHGLITL